MQSIAGTITDSKILVRADALVKGDVIFGFAVELALQVIDPMLGRMIMLTVRKIGGQESASEDAFAYAPKMYTLRPFDRLWIERR